VQPNNLAIMLLFLFNIVHFVLGEQPAVLWLLVKLPHVEKKVMSGEIAPHRKKRL
jgi:hypothetical protein